MDFFEMLEEALRPPVSWRDQLPIGITEYALKRFKIDMSCLTYADLYILPLTAEGENQRELLYKECGIGRYGSYEINFKYHNETFLAIIVNND